MLRVSVMLSKHLASCYVGHRTRPRARAEMHGVQGHRAPRMAAAPRQTLESWVLPASDAQTSPRAAARALRADCHSGLRGEKLIWMEKGQWTGALRQGPQSSSHSWPWRMAGSDAGAGAGTVLSAHHAGSCADGIDDDGMAMLRTIIPDSTLETCSLLND